jgi:hypothetical protein
LFLTRYGNPLNRDKLRQGVIRPALRAAGLPESFRTYDLRHSHASVMIDLGVNLLALAQRMGHSDPAMTLRLYGHLFEGAQIQLSEKIDELRAASMPTEASVIPAAVVRQLDRKICRSSSPRPRGDGVSSILELGVAGSVSITCLADSRGLDGP